jgi:mRNA interferase MazF
MGVVAQRFEIYLVNLDPTIGSEIRKTRPCVVISPDEMNKHVQTLILAPMTTKGQVYPTRVACTFQGKPGQIVLDQIRAVDRARLVKRLGRLTERQSKSVLAVLQEIFAE